MAYPNTIDSLTNPTSSDTLDSPSHSDQHSDANDAIEALEAKVGVDSSAVTSSHDYKIDALETDVASMVETVIGTIYPVGAIYTSTLSTNPETLFGFGTWEAFGEGKVLVGLDSEDGDFDEVEETGGSKTITLTEAQMPEHTHVQNAHGHSFNVSRVTAFAGTGSNEPTQSATSDRSWQTITIANATATNQNTGGDEAHSNLQPYIVVYMFKRTA